MLDTFHYVFIHLQLNQKFHNINLRKVNKNLTFFYENDHKILLNLYHLFLKNHMFTIISLIQYYDNLNSIKLFHKIQNHSISIYHR